MSFRRQDFGEFAGRDSKLSGEGALGVPGIVTNPSDEFVAKEVTVGFMFIEHAALTVEGVDPTGNQFWIKAIQLRSVVSGEDRGLC